jgi:hypothetical protein
MTGPAIRRSRAYADVGLRVPLIIIGFFSMLAVLGLVVVVVETWWVVAAVAAFHIFGSAVLGVLLIRALRHEEARAREDERRSL